MQAQDAASWYFSHVDPMKANHDNIRRYLRGPLLAVTVNALDSVPLDRTGGGAVGNEVIEEEKKACDHSWREYLNPIVSDGPSTYVWNEKGQQTYDSLGRRVKARMEAFLAGCTLAVPGKVPTIDVDGSSNQQKYDIVSIQDGLAGFGISKISKKDLARTTGTLTTATASASSSLSTVPTLMRPMPRPSMIPHPQIAEEDLVLRLDLYIRTIQRVRNLQEDCVIGMEPTKSLKARARYITRAFVATSGCVRSMSPVLTRLLTCLTMEMLAVEVLSEEVTKAMKRIVSEYEHGTSFASLAFLSTPEVNADSLLAPLVLKYLRYLQSEWEYLVKECQLERMLTRAIDPALRKMFKTIEFRSIGHLLEICHEQRSKLLNIELPPNVCAMAENINSLCHSKQALKQALKDLQREVIMVNGHTLPPFSSQKELLHILTQSLNSKSLTARKSSQRSPRKKKGGSKYKGVGSSPPKKEIFNSEDEGKGKVDSESDPFFSSTSCDSSESDLPKEKDARKSLPKKRRRSFHLSTIDVLTRRLLIAASRTGNGGDAYFVVRDLFGGEDVEVVPTSTLPIQGRMIRPGTIDIVVRLASVTIKCHQSFDIYPTALVGECEPLIQFHTTTTETIDLQEVRSADSDDSFYTMDQSPGSNDVDKNPNSFMVVQEHKSSRTGWRTISIRPAFYEKIEVWNTPS